VHSASPVGLTSPKNHDDMIKPAVNGNRYVIEAASKYKLKRIVVTSSVAAISHGKKRELYDETCWSDLLACKDNAYIKSKTMAEMYLWDYQREMKKLNQYCPEIATICPSVAFGEIIS
jgi:dihydroflavonol-4-reductase